jgi:Diacylglycerol acyltransferase
MPFWEIASWITNDLFLTVNCMLCVPMYSMAVGVAVYGGALWYASANGHSWAKTLLLLYLAFCISDARPTRAPGGTSGGREGSNAAAAAARVSGMNKGDWVDRIADWCRSRPMYRNSASYFPVTLHKTVDLDPSLSYIFTYHPHGVIAMGANAALVTNGCDFDDAFPGIKRHGVTLNIALMTPLFREWMLLAGMVSANKRTLVSTLINGRSIVLVPGGAKEALSAHKSNFRLHLKSRRGFIRVALEANAHPVPVLGFGENKAFETLVVDHDPHSAEASSSWVSALRKPSVLLHYCQQRLYKVMTFSMPILTSVVPNRNPIHVVVGKPVAFQGKTVEECHREYLKELERLYDQHKGNYGYQDIKLEFV